MNNTLKNILANRTLTTFILGVAVALLFLGQCNRIERLERKLDETEKVADRNFNNYLAAQDTIKLERNANQDLVASVRSYEFEVSALKKDKQKLIKKYEDALELNKKYIEINNLISAELEVKDSIIAAGVVSQNGDTLSINVTDKKEWDKYNWRSFTGQIDLLKVDTTYGLMSSNFMLNQGISLKMAIVEQNGINLLKVSSPYPGLEFTNIENINLVNDQLNRPRANKAGWSIGLGVGYGMNINNDQTLNFGPSFGIGLYYSPKWLRF